MRNQIVEQAINLDNTKEELVIIVDKDDNIVGNSSRFEMVIKIFFDYWWNDLINFWIRERIILFIDVLLY